MSSDLSASAASISEESLPIVLQSPRPEDSHAMLQLVRDSGVLEPNSCYAYMLMCQDFAETCVVAKRDGQLVGFVIGYRPPQRENALFVWQIGVAESARRQGLAHRMLDHLIQQFEPGFIQYVEATIAASNQPSRKMFEKFAARHGVEFGYTDWFTERHFGGDEHEAEPLIRIGPFTDND